MVEQLAADRICGRSEAPRRPEVGFARLGISARVIVSNEDRGAAVSRGIDDDRPQREVDAARVSLVARQVEAARLAVEMHYPQSLERRIGFSAAGLKELARAGDAIEDYRGFGTLIPHAPMLREPRLPNDRNRVRFGAPFRMEWGPDSASRKTGELPLHKRRNRIISAPSKK